jgi:hypothetical protein
VARLDRIRRITGDEELAKIRKARIASKDMLPVLIERLDPKRPDKAKKAQELDIVLDIHTGFCWVPPGKSKYALPIYLETNGVLHDPLGKIIEHLDFISMDIKLPSTSGQSWLWEEHKLFIQGAARKNVVVKVVIGEETQEWEIIKACEIIASVNRDIPLILQPRTLSGGKIGIKPLQTLQLQEIAATFLKETRIIPQTHVFSGYL